MSAIKFPVWANKLSNRPPAWWAKVDMTPINERGNLYWKKRYKGKPKYCPVSSFHDKGQYEAAYSAFLEWKKEQDSPNHPVRNSMRDAIEVNRRMLDHLQNVGESDWIPHVQGNLKALEILVDAPVSTIEGFRVPPADESRITPANVLLNPIGILGERRQGYWEGVFAATENKPERPNAVLTVGETIKKFNTEKLIEVGNGEFKDGHAANLRERLTTFEKFLGSTSLITNIVDATLPDYRLYLFSLPEKSKDWISKRVKAATDLVKWAALRSLIDVPRVLLVKTKQLSVKVPTKQVVKYEDSEVAELFKGLNEFTTKKMLTARVVERMKLVCLLCLNCGMTQQDISDLLHSEVDWTEGKITRKRSKTDDHPNVPIVSYPLWPSTFELLKKLRSDDPEYVLVGSNGNPLKKEYHNANKEYVKIDVLGTYFDRWRKKANLTHLKSLKYLRKAGTSKLDEKTDFSRYSEHYEGHAPSTISEKYYKDFSLKQFEKAVQWLGQQWNNIGGYPPNRRK